MLKARRMGLLAVAALCTFWAGSAQAANETFRFRGNGAYGVLSANDPCVMAGLDISAFASSRKESGTQQTEALQVFISFWAYNSCTMTFVQGGTSGNVGTFTSNKQTASYTGTFEVGVFDELTGFTPVTMNLTVSWTSTGNVNKGTSHFVTRTATGIQHSRFTGTDTSASITATAAIPGSSFSLSGEGSITDNMSGSTTVTR